MTTRESAPCVFIDLDAVAAVSRPVAGARASAAPAGSDRVVAYPDALRVLAELLAGGARVGLITESGLSGETGLDPKLGEVVDPDLVLDAESGDVVAAALDAAGDARCVVVSADRERRARALDAGARVAPHPRLVSAVLSGESLRYLLVPGAPWPEALDELNVVALRGHV